MIRLGVVRAAAAGLSLVALAGCGSADRGTSATRGPGARSADHAARVTAAPSGRTARRSRPTRPDPSYPVLTGVGALGPRWHPAVTVRGRIAAWVAERGGVTMIRFDQSQAQLVLHAGSVDPGPGPWRYGDAIRGPERERVVAAFNSGFKLDTGAGGWESGGHAAVALIPGRGSIVTYRDGITDIGAWRHGVPSGQPLASVRQNLSLLVDAGTTAATASNCIEACWGATLGGGASVARSALGIDAGGRLIYGAAASATPQSLAQGLIDGGVLRAVELDINPEWVAAYLYRHARTAPPRFVPVIPGQVGVPGQFLTPDSRDFFAVLAR